VLLHIVTGGAALRLLLPHLSKELQRRALAYLWQSVAALAATYVDEDASVEVAPATLTQEEIVGRSIETNDPHAIKFVEACIRESRVQPSPTYLAAAQDWAKRLYEAKHWSNAERVAAGSDVPRPLTVAC